MKPDSARSATLTRRCDFRVLELLVSSVKLQLARADWIDGHPF